LLKEGGDNLFSVDSTV